MNVADLKLCEFYWQQIKRVICGQDPYKRLFFKLRLPALMVEQSKIFMPSASIQDAVASIIREILFFEDGQRQIQVDEMLSLAMQIFIISS